MPKKEKKPEGGDFLIDLLTALLITVAVGIVGFGGILAYSSISYRNQIAEVQAQQQAAQENTPKLSGYSYSGPNGTYRPDDWPEPTARASSNISVKSGSQEAPEEREEAPEVEKVPEEAPAPPMEPEPVPEQPVQTSQPEAEPSKPAQSVQAGGNSSALASYGGNSQGSDTEVSSKNETQSSNSSPSSSKGNADNFNAHYNPGQKETSANYVLNTSTKKFHIPTCNDVEKIAEKNYSESNDSRDSIISAGYTPCGHCNP